jgi:hypothetical protein
MNFDSPREIGAENRVNLFRSWSTMNTAADEARNLLVAQPVPVQAFDEQRRDAIDTRRARRIRHDDDHTFKRFDDLFEGR